MKKSKDILPDWLLDVIAQLLLGLLIGIITLFLVGVLFLVIDFMAWALTGALQWI